MSELIKKLEKILKKKLVDENLSEIDLSDDDCMYRKFYFDYLPEQTVHEALFLFPNGERLYEKYIDIINGITTSLIISDSELCTLVNKHLSASISIMDKSEDESAINFIQNFENIHIAADLEKFEPGKNSLHKYVYGAINEFILEELPDEDALWLLYDWSLEKTKWATVSAYLLEDFFDSISLKKNGIFEPGFKLWLSQNSNHYWAEDNSLSARNVLCKAFK